MDQQLTHRCRVVSIGGGTGQSVLLQALRTFDCDITAIVAMADDGGSTGILRQYTHMPPPGDIRKCLVALAKDPHSLTAQVFSHRMPEVDNHALGNLVLMALMQETHSFIEAIQACEKLLECTGCVMPSTTDDISLVGESIDGEIVTGQANISRGGSTMKRVWIEPEHPSVYQPCLEKIEQADLIVLGPGSLFTSIIPNLLVPDIAQAVKQSSATKVFICPKSNTQGETWGMTSEEYLKVLLVHGLEDALDIAVLHRAESDKQYADGKGSKTDYILDEKGCVYTTVSCTDQTIAQVEALGVRAIVDDFDTAHHPYQHDIEKLGKILEGIWTCRSPLR